jgi:hypothetical protein
MVVLDPSTPGGVRLSAAREIHAVVGAQVRGPMHDDAFVKVRLGVPPFCGPASVPMFGVNYTEMYVGSNGRVMFGGPTGDPSPTPSVAAALSGQPFVGAWTNLAPQTAGSIFVYPDANNHVRVVYHAVPYFALTQPLTLNTFTIDFDPTTGVIQLMGMAIGTTTTYPMFLGISKGAGATDPGPANFAIGGPNAPATPSDMIYKFGLGSPGLAPGVQTITFTPTGSGGYSWTGS